MFPRILVRIFPEGNKLLRFLRKLREYRVRNGFPSLHALPLTPSGLPQSLTHWHLLSEQGSQFLMLRGRFSFAALWCVCHRLCVQCLCLLHSPEFSCVSMFWQDCNDCKCWKLRQGCGYLRRRAAEFLTVFIAFEITKLVKSFDSFGPFETWCSSRWQKRNTIRLPEGQKRKFELNIYRNFRPTTGLLLGTKNHLRSKNRV